MNDTKLNEEINEQIAYDNYKKNMKSLYLLIKLDVDGEIVFDYKDAENYAKNFCNNMEFELIDHCLEETDNDDLYIGCDDLRDKVKTIEDKMSEYEDLKEEPMHEGLEVWPWNTLTVY